MALSNGSILRGVVCAALMIGVCALICCAGRNDEGAPENPAVTVHNQEERWGQLRLLFQVSEEL
jgi:hypothetical protein